jgi:hypothetical protein
VDEGPGAAASAPRRARLPPRSYADYVERDDDDYEEEEEAEEEIEEEEEEEEEEDTIIGGMSRGSSHVTGVSWNQRIRKWEARAKMVEGKRALLGSHATEEAAARAIHSFAKHGIDSVTHRVHTSQFKGVY